MKTAREIIENYDGPDVRIMEVCGTHTHEIFRLGIRKLLPKQVELISGPGCPVCVTPVSFIDEAIYLALEKGVTICTFGDLARKFRMYFFTGRLSDGMPVLCINTGRTGERTCTGGNAGSDLSDW